MSASVNPTDPAPSAPLARVRLRVWDAPVRLSHWALVALVAAAWWTAERRMLEWHRLAGYAILAVVVFRLAWGIVGGATARFSSFVRGPAAVAAYLRDRTKTAATVRAPGHNPLGGWSVVAMLGLLLAQPVLGLFSVDVDGLESGPLAYLVSFEEGRVAARLHHLVFNLLLGLIALHLAAITLHLLVDGDNLLGPMLTGRRSWPGDPPSIRFASPWLGPALAGLAAALVWTIVALFGRA